MIFLYWPHRRIPQWLERIEFDDGTPVPAWHAGFGLAVRVRRTFHVWHMAGLFIYVKGDGNRHVSVSGGLDGVHVNRGLLSFLLDIRATASTNASKESAP